MKSSVLKSKNQIIKKNLPRINFRSLTKENEEVVNEYKRKSNDENTVKETEAKKLRKEEQSVYFETDAEEVNKLCAAYAVTIIHQVRKENLSGLIVMSVINWPMKFTHLTVHGKILEKIVGCVIKMNNSILLKKRHMRKVITILNII